ncbi:acetyltransferase [Ollibium composti]|uniref:Acetyltransferase n=1 Tax=Ollibium composti TaxID=2675109 RepID=A0ABY2Q6A1_9HYPH|nr:acetyltransferase [Mesorhizobium composti]THF56605.1 acetyltransferase [Mesorhizobium composti]
MKRSLLVLGCGGHGRVVADAAFECGYDEVAFLDDVGSAHQPRGLKVLGPFAATADFAPDWPAAIAAVGNGDLRLRLFHDIRQLGFETPSIVHPSAVVSRGALIGNGVFVAAGAIINTDARIGDAVIVNTGARIDHDCEIGVGSHIAPGATLSGSVVVGQRTWLGTGCSVRQGTRIGEKVMVGVGAAVVSDLADGLTYVGVPARVLKNAR